MLLVRRDLFVAPWKQFVKGSRVIRSGCWCFDAGICRAADRNWFAPAYRDFHLIGGTEYGGLGTIIVGSGNQSALVQRSKEMKMGHKIHIQSKEQYIAAINVLNYTTGTWLGVGPSSAPVIVITDNQFDALVRAGVVSANGEEVKARGKKPTAKKAKS